MSQLKTYKLFISHSWTYSDVYEKLVSFSMSIKISSGVIIQCQKMTPFITYQMTRLFTKLLKIRCTLLMAL